jgi:hypothetical protein
LRRLHGHFASSGRNAGHKRVLGHCSSDVGIAAKTQSWQHAMDQRWVKGPQRSKYTLPITSLLTSPGRFGLYRAHRSSLFMMHAHAKRPKLYPDCS